MEKIKTEKAERRRGRPKLERLIVWIFHAGLCRHADFPQSSLHFPCCVPDLNGTDRKVSEIDAIGAGQLVLRRHSAELNTAHIFHADT